MHSTNYELGHCFNLLTSNAKHITKDFFSLKNLFISMFLTINIRHYSCCQHDLSIFTTQHLIGLFHIYYTFQSNRNVQYYLRNKLIVLYGQIFCHSLVQSALYFGQKQTLKSTLIYM